MNSFKQVLSDDELLEIATSKGSFIHKNEDGVFVYGADKFPISRAFLLGMLRAVDVSVQIKLAEQKEPDRSITHNQKLGAIKDGGAIEKTSCVSENAESETQKHVTEEYKRFCDWCDANPSFDLDSRLHTSGGTIDNGGYISDEKARIAFAAWRAARGNQYEN